MCKDTYFVDVNVRRLLFVLGYLLVVKCECPEDPIVLYARLGYLFCQCERPGDPV